MVNSVYKGYILIATGAEVDTWGTVLNAQALERIDANVGGIVSKGLTNIDVTLTADENRNLILRLTGTLTGNVLITTTLQGMMMVENLTTGAFAVTFTNGVGSPITLAQGFRTLVIADATNGPRKMASDEPAFPSGTRMLFQQTAAPTGWTKITTHDNKALRIVSGSVVNGGSVAFTTAFASQSVAGTVGNTALTIDQIPAHTHSYDAPLITNSPTGSGASRVEASTPGSTGSAGGGQTHTHTFTGTAINLAVAYVDLILASKD